MTNFLALILNKYTFPEIGIFKQDGADLQFQKIQKLNLRTSTESYSFNGQYQIFLTSKFSYFISFDIKHLI